MAATCVELPFANGRRDLVSNPQKGAMLLQRTPPPLLETPFEVFDRGVFTPNDRFYVRWHLANIPSSVDPATFRLNIRGHVRRSFSLSPHDLARDFEPFEIAAVNQCSGNSRGFFSAIAVSWTVPASKVSVELPTNETPFPPGRGAAELTPQCLICHSADMVLHQPPLTPGEWVGEINKMRNAFGAPLPANQVEELVRYLCSINGRQCSSGG
jgi:DMSO/TMAO reductase YedYZ molybdopterin-dependent catalytic subunit